MHSTYAYVMRTVDRTPRRNYLGETLRSIAQSCGEAAVGDHLILLDSGPSVSHTEIPWWAAEIDGMPHPNIYTSTVKLTNNQNALRALQIGLATGAEWIIHLEDDIQVCADLFGSIDRWLHKHATPAYHLFTFHTPYPHVRRAFEAGKESWKYPIHNFYGNQCWAMRRADAHLAVAFLEEKIPQWRSGQGFDLLLKEWAWATWTNAKYFLASCPSFVQHVGTESSLHFGRFHQNGSFPGTEWSYR